MTSSASSKLVDISNANSQSNQSIASTYSQKKTLDLEPNPFERSFARSKDSSRNTSLSNGQGQQNQAQGQPLQLEDLQLAQVNDQLALQDNIPQALNLQAQQPNNISASQKAQQSFQNVQLQAQASSNTQLQQQAMSPPVLTPGGTRRLASSSVLPPLTGLLSPGGSMIGTPGIWSSLFNPGTPGNSNQYQNFNLSTLISSSGQLSPNLQSQLTQQRQQLQQNQVQNQQNQQNQQQNQPQDQQLSQQNQQPQGQDAKLQPNGNQMMNPAQQQQLYNFIMNAKKTGLTPNESSLRTGLTPGANGLPSNAYSMLMPTGPATPGTLSLLGLQSNQSPARNFNSIGSNTNINQTKNTVPDDNKLDTGSNGKIKIVKNVSVPNTIDNTNAITSNPPPDQFKGASILNLTPASNASNLEHAQIELDKKKTRPRPKRAAKSKSEDVRSTKKRKTRKSPAVESMDSSSPNDYENIEENSVKRKKREPNSQDEKRKNFLERNRVAASKCRQRKKEMIESMKKDLHFYSSQYDSLTEQVNTLREHALTLRTILYAHKDCKALVEQVGGIETLNTLLNGTNYVANIPQAHAVPKGPYLNEMDDNNNMHVSAPPIANTVPQLLGNGNPQASVAAAVAMTTNKIIAKQENDRRISDSL